MQDFLQLIQKKSAYLPMEKINGDATLEVWEDPSIGTLPWPYNGESNP
jgi:hypothetical protein